MPPSSSSKSSKPKPSDVAAENKKYYIPLLRKNYANTWPTYSYVFSRPLELSCDSFTNRSLNPAPPNFWVYHDDPVDFTMNWASANNTRVAFICAANERRPGGDWETGVVGYEERLCRRSSLSVTLSTPGPNSTGEPHYPIPHEGGIYSDKVVIFRGPHDRYEKMPPENWRDLPVVSVTPTRWPKLKDNGTKYSFADEREMAKNKLRAALTICAWNQIRSVVIGDFGLGNTYRNPPQEMAELWREVFLYDPNLRGRIENAAFVFEDPGQSTAKLILDDMAKKSKSGGSKSSKGKSSSSSNSHASSSNSSANAGCPTDMQIYEHVFSPQEVNRVLTQPDPRLGLNNLVL